MQLQPCPAPAFIVSGSPINYGIISETTMFRYAEILRKLSRYDNIYYFNMTDQVWIPQRTSRRGKCVNESKITKSKRC